MISWNNKVGSTLKLHWSEAAPIKATVKLRRVDYEEECRISTSENGRRTSPSYDVFPRLV